jgi:hypothetical protein
MYIYIYICVCVCVCVCVSVCLSVSWQSLTKNRLTPRKSQLDRDPSLNV